MRGEHRGENRQRKVANGALQLEQRWGGEELEIVAIGRNK
jgi:hypothetical protein